MPRKLKPPSLWLSDDDDFEHHGAAILLMVRDGIAGDWQDLCRTLRFDRDPRTFHSGHLGLKGTIENLVEAGLLESDNKYLGPYRVTELAFKVLGGLSVSLTQAANMPQYNGLAVRPLFGKPARLEAASHVFVIMPFDKELRRVYDGPVKAACRALRLSVERADDIFSTRELLTDIWNALVNSFVVIADCTGRNANVFYELGIAHTLGKPVILLTQSEKDVPTDVIRIRYIKYAPTVRGLAKLESNLRRTLRDTLDLVWPANKPLQPTSGARGRDKRAVTRATRG